ncbi:MAG: hypothetical protein LBQ12_08655 [Deltaproteobacteria bacterium]|jgi:Fe-S cluster assembly iron-binding protein IscA|nr:hypothetical protein [Deltaproteobacteria bacterium]
MITITTEASRRLLDYLASRNAPLSVRIFAPKLACGPSGSLSLTVDGPAPGDHAVAGGGLTLLMDRALLDRTGRITIDYGADEDREGFTVRSEKELPVREACSACDGCR